MQYKANHVSRGVEIEFLDYLRSMQETFNIFLVRLRELFGVHKSLKASSLIYGADRNRREVGEWVSMPGIVLLARYKLRHETFLYGEENYALAA